MNGKTLLTMGIDPDNDVPVNSCDLGFRHHRTNTHLQTHLKTKLFPTQCSLIYISNYKATGAMCSVHSLSTKVGPNRTSSRLKNLFDCHLTKQNLNSTKKLDKSSRLVVRSGLCKSKSHLQRFASCHEQDCGGMKLMPEMI